MSVSGVYSNYTSAMYNWQQDLQSTQSDQSGAGSSTAATTTSQSGKSNSAAGYQGMSTVSSLVELTQAAMDAMGVKGNERTTFSQISKYKTQLEKDYAADLKSALISAGLPDDISFRLQQDSDGKLKVVSDDQGAQATIQKIFDSNPELTQQYEKIQAMANLETARKSLNVSPTDLKKRIQIESMASWWANSGNSTNSLGVFSGGDISMYSGINTTA